MPRIAALVTLAAALALGALGITGFTPVLAPLEERLLFSPSPVDAKWLHSLASLGSGIEEVRLQTPDGVTLHGWLKRPARYGAQARSAGQRYPLVIVYGGVRREVSDFARYAHAPAEWGWLVINYRGFGLSEGTPSEHNMVEDAKRIYDWAAARPEVDSSNIVVLGRSLGSYAAVAVAAARQARAAILATPFDSFVALSATRFPHLPVSWLVGGRYDPAALAPRVFAPALFVLAENDDVTPMEHGQALARAWGGLTQTVLLRGASHYGIERRDEFWRSVGDYLAALKPVTASSRWASAPALSRSK
jgi:hypothetical protein